jgi:hypothetical protein
MLGLPSFNSEFCGPFGLSNADESIGIFPQTAVFFFQDGRFGSPGRRFSVVLQG